MGTGKRERERERGGGRRKEGRGVGTLYHLADGRQRGGEVKRGGRGGEGVKALTYLEHFVQGESTEY